MLNSLFLMMMGTWNYRFLSPVLSTALFMHPSLWLSHPSASFQTCFWWGCEWPPDIPEGQVWQQVTATAHFQPWGSQDKSGLAGLSSSQAWEWNHLGTVADGSGLVSGSWDGSQDQDGGRITDWRKVSCRRKRDRAGGSWCLEEEGRASSLHLWGLQIWEVKDGEGQSVSATKGQAWGWAGGSRKVRDSGMLLNT